MDTKSKFFTLLHISFRNVIRQKRRNILLGTAIGFGMMILVVANSFSQGISDILLNHIVVYTNGHLELFMSHKGSMYTSAVFDRPRFEAILKSELKEAKGIRENVGAWVQGVGNGKSDFMAIVGISPDDDYFRSVTVISGNVSALKQGNLACPVVLTKAKADYLKVKVGDVVKAQLKTIHGQVQTAMMQVVAITESQNMFMDMAVFVPIHSLKTLMGYQPNETGGYHVILKNPQTAIQQADAIHKKFKPSIALIQGSSEGIDFSVFGLGLYSNTLSTLNRSLKVSEGKPFSLNAEGAWISRSVAEALKLSPGQALTFTYTAKFSRKTVTVNVNVEGILETVSWAKPNNVVLLADKTFFKYYYNPLPIQSGQPGVVLSPNHPLTAWVVPEWKLLERTKTSDELRKKMRETVQQRYKGSVLDVRTMYESASDVLKLEKAFNFITFFAVLVLFGIILVGLVNTLRMTIRERTREIGTLRSIGLQRGDIVALFMLETALLTGFSSLLGILGGFITMGLLGHITIYSQSMFSLFLLNHHLHFMPNWVAIVLNVLFIQLIIAITTYFPARRASRLTPSDALRHVE